MSNRTLLYNEDAIIYWCLDLSACIDNVHKQKMLSQWGPDKMDKIFARRMQAAFAKIFPWIKIVVQANISINNGTVYLRIFALGLNEWIVPTDAIKFYKHVHQVVIARICDFLFWVAILVSWNIKPRGNNLTGNNLYPGERHSCQEDDNFRWDTINKRSMIDGWMIICGVEQFKYHMIIFSFGAKDLLLQLSMEW